MKRSTAGWMLALGLLAIAASSVGVRHWTAISAAAQIYYGIALVLGVTAGASGVWGLFGPTAGRRMALLGAASLVVLAVNQATGMIVNSIACYSPG
jgi:hypothetical protein